MLLVSLNSLLGIDIHTLFLLSTLYVLSFNKKIIHTLLILKVFLLSAQWVDNKHTRKREKYLFLCIFFTPFNTYSHLLLSANWANFRNFLSPLFPLTPNNRKLFFLFFFFFICSKQILKLDSCHTFLPYLHFYHFKSSNPAVRLRFILFYVKCFSVKYSTHFSLFGQARTMYCNIFSKVKRFTLNIFLSNYP